MGKSEEKAVVVLSCVLPIFNEEDGIYAFLECLVKQLVSMCVSYEIILVDDGSADNTVKKVESFIASSPEVSHISLVVLSRNFGKEAALTAGLDVSTGDAVVLLDADFQHPVEMLSTFYEYWQQGYDMVYGVRQCRKEESFLKRKGALLFYKMMGYSAGVSIPVDAGDFRLMSRRVVNAIGRIPERARFMKGIYAWVGFKSIGVPFQVQERYAGVSQWDYRKLTNLALAGITSFSTFPLRFMAGFGLLISVVAFLYVFYITGKTFIIGSDLPGWPTIVAAIMGFSGVQLISLGILGEYIAGIFFEVKRRPLYLVKDRKGGANAVVGDASNR